MVICSVGSAQQDAVSIHVSNSGSDANDGLSEQSPKRTVKAGIAALGKQNGKPHWLLLERGSRWDRADEGGTDWRWANHGASETERCGVKAYGDPAKARPVLENGALWYGSKGRPLKHFDVRGIEFVATVNDPESPKYQTGTAGHRGLFIAVELDAAQQTRDITIEDCVFRFMNVGTAIYCTTDGLSSQAVSVKENQFIDCRSFGLMMTRFSQSEIISNRFVRCGWENRTVKLHAAYLTDCDYCTVMDNLFFQPGNWGLKFSSNGNRKATNFHILNNVFYGGGLGIGHADFNSSWNPLTEYSHADGIVSGNLFSAIVKDFPAGSGQFQSIAVNIGNVDNCQFVDNIFAHTQQEAGTGEIFRFADPTDEISQRITLQRNRVHNWASKHRRTKGTYIANMPADTVQVDNLTESAAFVDPTKGLESFADSLGQTVESLPENAAATASAIMDHVRVGFAIVAVPEPVPDTVIAVREADLVNLIQAVEGVLSALKQMAGKQ
jgi:hypothetical protein